MLSRERLALRDIAARSVEILEELLLTRDCFRETGSLSGLVLPKTTGLGLYCVLTGHYKSVFSAALLIVASLVEAESQLVHTDLPHFLLGVKFCFTFA